MKPWGACLLAEHPDGVDEVQGCTHGPLGVALVGEGRAPHRHDRVADELLHDPPVAGDGRPSHLEVARQEISYFFWVPCLREWREANEVAEEHRADPALRDAGGRGRAGGHGCEVTVARYVARVCHGAATLRAKARVGGRQGAASRAGAGQRRAAALAELRVGRVVRRAIRTTHRRPLVPGRPSEAYRSPFGVVGTNRSGGGCLRLPEPPALERRASQQSSCSMVSKPQALAHLRRGPTNVK